MKTLKYIAGVVCLWLVAACSSYSYYAVGNENVNLSRYSSFAWIPSMNAGNDTAYNDIVEGRINDAATTALEAKGLTLKTRNPDLLVRSTVMVRDKTKTYNEPVYNYVGGGYYPRIVNYRGGRALYYTYRAPFAVYAGTDVQEVPYQEGTLMIDLIDRKTRKVIWRGYGVGEVNNPERAVKDIPEVVNGIINKLPLKKM